MSNSYLTSTLISQEAVAIFKTLNTFYSSGYKGNYEQMFNGSGYKAGDTINIRQDNFFIGQRGDTVTAEDIVEESFPLTIQPLYSIPIAYTPTDLQRKINDFSAEFVEPAIRRLVAMLNNDIYTAAKTQINYYTGDRTAYTNSFASINAVNPVLTRLNANGYKRYLALSPENATQAMNSSSLQNAFVSPLNKDITYDARLGRLAGMDIMQDSSIVQHTPGTHAASGDITVSVAVGSGSTITLAGLTTGATFKAGDSFSIAGVKAFDRINRVPLVTDMQFVVTADATASGATLAISVFPALTADGPRQNFYVAGASPNEIPSGAVITFVGNGSSQTYVNNIAYTERGLIVVIPPLQRMDSPESDVTTKSGISIRVSKTAEVLDNKNIMRLDMQAAYHWVPNQAVRLIAKP
jgi:hypothetical protein